jgi:hypothetical protein
MANNKLKPMTVLIRGVEYPDAKAAAKHFKIDVSTVYWMIGKGKADRIGLGRGCNGRRAPGIPFTVGAYTWPSRRKAEIALGLPSKYIERSLRLKNESAMKRIILAAMKWAARGEVQRMKEQKDEFV